METSMLITDGCLMATYKPSQREIEILNHIRKHTVIEFNNDFEVTSDTDIQYGEIHDLYRNYFIQNTDDSFRSYELSMYGKFFMDNTCDKNGNNTTQQ